MNTCGYRIIKQYFSQVVFLQREGGEEEGIEEEGKKKWNGGGRGEEEK